MEKKRKKFIDALEATKEKIVRELPAKELGNLSEQEFEKRFAETLMEFYDGKVEYKKGAHTFPDIQCGRFGAEVKTTKSNKWLGMGNSIMEGTRAQGVEEIFVVFLKKGGIPEIRIREYDKVVSDIKVTHSPRYSINMELKDGESIFSQLNIEYDDFRNDKNKINILKNYYREKGEATWWIDNQTGESITSMGVVPFDTLPKIDKHKYMVELYALFPEILESDYGGASVYLVTKYGIHDKSFRDKFSAGGSEIVSFQEKKEDVSKNIYKLLSMIEDVVNFLRKNPDIIREEWGTDEKDIVSLWFKQCELSLAKDNKLKKPSFSLHEYYKNKME